MQIYQNQLFRIIHSIILGIFIIYSTFPYEVKAQTIYDETLNQITKQTTPLDKSYHVEVSEETELFAITDNALYIVNPNLNSISVISTENFTKLIDIPVGDHPRYIAIDESENKAYVANEGDNSISVISTENDTWIKNIRNITIDDHPRYIAIDEYENKTIIAGDHSISFISTENDTKIGEDISIRDHPRYIAIEILKNKAYVANAFHSISVISTENDTWIKDIPGKPEHSSIDIGPNPVRAYVANPSNHSISVISTENDTWIKDIPVGDHPRYIAIDNIYEKAYVANGGDNSISVISTENDTKIKDIPVGKYPVYIALDWMNNKAYVANGGDNSISVISTENDTKIKDIPVGYGPGYIVIDEKKDAIYVVNLPSHSISVIDGRTDNVVGRFIFNINPPNSGYIKCGNTVAPLEKSFYIWSDTLCSAFPNKGFEFLSWEQNIGSNATQLINTSKPATAIESFLDVLNLKPEEPEATLKVSTFGNFTASFKELPPPLPPEYWATLFGFVITTGLGVWLIPSLVRWARARADTKKSNYYYQKIKSLYNDGSLDENDLKDLDKLRIDITDAHSKGKVNELHYNSLKNEISMLYEEIFRKRIESLTGSLKNTSSKEQLKKLKDDIENAYSKQKITELQFNLLGKKIQEITDEDNKK